MVGPTRHDLSDKIVLVTGASRGLGRALARAFAGAGAKVAICARGEEALGEVVDEIRAEGGEVLARTADVTSADEVGAWVERAEDRWGAPSALVNNASLLGERTPLRDYPLDNWRAVLDVNTTGALIATRAVLPAMRRAGAGSIITVTSGVGNHPRADWGAYAVSKHAVEAFTFNLAREEADAGIRANAVDPGAMRTRMRATAYPDEDPETLPPPERVTGVFLWLASDASRGTTGERFRAQEWG